MNVSLVTSPTPDLRELWLRAHKDVTTRRGGVALLEAIGGSLAEDELLTTLVATSSLWQVTDDGTLKAIGIYRARVIEAIYVATAFRRQRVATTLVETLLAHEPAPLDAYALPGDRAMKSLFESLGWKARLLTMRGA